MRQYILLVCATALAVVLATETPVIGVLDQPSDGGKQNYIAASYVKFLESAGARVVPISNTGNVTYFMQMFKGLNGLLIPGGSADITSPDASYRVAGQTFLKAALAAFDQGDYFPIWGTCLGFELLAILVAEDNSVLVGDYDSWNLPLPLNFTEQAASGRMFAEEGARLLNILASQPVTMNNHHFGIEPDVWTKNSKLTAFFDLLSTNVDLAGKGFVSTIEGKKYPIYATQWHPEKNNFEWTQSGIPHTKEGVYVAQAAANFIVAEARKSTHAFTEAELDRHLIYNYNPVRSHAGSFEQIYQFKPHQ